MRVVSEHNPDFLTHPDYGLIWLGGGEKFISSVKKLVYSPVFIYSQKFNEDECLSLSSADEEHLAKASLSREYGPCFGCMQDLKHDILLYNPQ